MSLFEIKNTATKKSESKNFRIRIAYWEYIGILENKYDVSQNKLINMCIEFTLENKDFSKNDDIINNIFDKYNKKSVIRTVRIKKELYDRMTIIRDNFRLTMNSILNKSLDFALNNMNKEEFKEKETEKEEVFN